MNPTRSPVAVELFAQWRRRRGERPAFAVQPFSRNWEKLLDDANLMSATDRSDAERDVWALAAGKWIEIKTIPYRPEIIGRVAIPLAAEERWRAVFGFVPPSDAEARLIAGFPWLPELEFVRDGRLSFSFDELRRLNEFLRSHPGDGPVVPIKERSLEIFGDEKRLDTLRQTTLFGAGGLTLTRLECRRVVEPLGWQRGPQAAGPVIVLENAATWDSYRRWNKECGKFGAVVYGQGICFADRVLFLREIFRELGGITPVYYFGDLDATGLRIPALASCFAEREGLPQVAPHFPSYRWLLAHAAQATPANEDDPARPKDVEWLGELRAEAWLILERNQRLAQEHVGWEFLRTRTSDA